MTKHTDTSRIADLRFQVSEKMPINHSDLSCLFDRIEALEAENMMLREERDRLIKFVNIMCKEYGLEYDGVVKQ